MANHVGKVIKSTLASVMVVAMVPTLSLAETVGDGEDLVAAAEPVVQGPSIDENEADLVSEATATQQPLSDELLKRPLSQSAGPLRRMLLAMLGTSIRMEHGAT